MCYIILFISRNEYQYKISIIYESFMNRNAFYSDKLQMIFDHVKRHDSCRVFACMLLCCLFTMSIKKDLKIYRRFSILSRNVAE